MRDTREHAERASRLRAELLRRVAERSGASSRVIDAMGSIPRERFVSGLSLEQAYEDGPYPIGHGQTISQPTVIAMMTDALALREDSRVLEIGTGCGYQTAILARLSAWVYTVELLAELARDARQRLAALGLENVILRIGDGYEGWPEQAPFDRIIVTAAPPELPDTLIQQLADDGILVAPIGRRFSQELVRIRKKGTKTQRENLGPVAFVPMVHG